jgi:hypothetical protein
MRKWEVTYRLEGSTKYHKRIVEALYQHEAKQIAQAEMPNADIRGNPRPI